MAAIPPPKPHIFVIPGAYHPGSVMNLFIKSLEAAGFSAETTTNPSAGTSGATTQEDIANVQALLAPHIAEGKDIVVVAHSYGGVIASGVIAGLDKRGREAQGLKGLETEGVTYARNHIEVFYHDVSPELAKSVIASLKPQSALSVKTKFDTVGWLDKTYDGRRAYIRCLQDHALPLMIQDGMVAGSGVEWITKSLESSHSPFLSMPDELTRVVAEIVAEFAQN
ncbi:hypothetical protein TrVFT333_001387 [Trichoderma virens FT-333]|nr:hypothetical protein TrVFT333_001387 [Trichoderma virens FT-333]